jgi:phosphotransferase system enzyme I (PtsP)
MIRSLDRALLMPAVEALLAAPPADMRGALSRWAEENGVSTG